MDIEALGTMLAQRVNNSNSRMVLDISLIKRNYFGLYTHWYQIYYYWTFWLQNASNILLLIRYIDTYIGRFKFTVETAGRIEVLIFSGHGQYFNKG